MSFFILAHADPQKQECCRRRTEEVLRGLDLQTCVSDKVCGAWICAAAPGPEVVSMHRDGRETSFILGYALDETGRRLDPPELAARWRLRPDFQPDGYFMAAVVREDGSFTAAVDPLGLFPCFYTQLPDGGWLLAAAARDLSIHPDFRTRPDFEGIAGQLLVNSPLENRTVLEGVRQLPIRTVLHARKGCPPRFAEAPLPIPAAVSSPQEAHEEFHRLWTRAVRRHSAVPKGAATDLLLSGGRDSRMVAATLIPLGCHFRPVTYGLPFEYEARAARAVSRSLKTKGFLLLNDTGPASTLAAWKVRALRCGGYGGGTFGALGPHPALRPWLHHGLMLDLLLGGYATGFSRHPVHDQPDPAFFFENLKLWGLPEAALSALFRDPDARGIPGQLRERMLADFGRRAHEPDQASFDGLHATRVRHHLGSGLWGLTQTTWPIVPLCDQALHAFVRSLSHELVKDRILQKVWMAQRCPELLKIPFDNNTHRFAAEKPNWRWPSWRRRGFAAAQPLRYHRVLSARSPGWIAVDREANAARPALSEWFHPEGLDRLWPERLQEVPHTNPFAELAGVRSLMVLAGFFAQSF